MSRRAARLCRDYGVDPETQIVETGAWKFPTVRQLLGYNSPERRLERRIIRELLGDPERDQFIVRDIPEPCDLRKVGYLVSESCVSVSIRRMGYDIVVRVIL
jgi:hypothetical protein